MKFYTDDKIMKVAKIKKNMISNAQHFKNVLTPMKIDFTYTDERPDQNPDLMWELQVKLDVCAQELFGKRNPDKLLFCPIFINDGPYVMNTRDGGYAALSLNAAGYWPTAIYELAHETIHLLDPRLAYPSGKGANWFEEGLAVHFSLAVSKEIGDKSTKVNHEKYKKANQLFNRIGGDLFQKSKEIRSRCGHFSDAEVSDILAVSPSLPPHIAKKLVSSFYS